MFSQILRQDLEAFLARTDNELFFNEGDFQMHLAIYLRETHHYDDVDIEYYIPYSQLDNYIWKNELYLDIVVRKGAEYIPIELKYPTLRVTRKICRFGEQLPDDVDIVKSQGAQNFVAYNFWKDVRRLELVKRRFPAVKTGFAVMLTNDPSFRRGRRPGSNCEQMSTEDGIHRRSRHWNRPPAGATDKDDFDLDREYEICWKSAAPLEGEPFTYCIIEV